MVGRGSFPFFAKGLFVRGKLNVSFREGIPLTKHHFQVSSQIPRMQLVMNGVWFVLKTVGDIKRSAPCFTNTSTFPRSSRKIIHM